MSKFLIHLKPFWYLFTKNNQLNFFLKISLFACLIKLFILRRILNDKKVSINLGGLKIMSPNSEIASILLKEKFVFEEYFLPLNKNNPIIFDFGSSIGISILYFKTMYPDSEIFAFEPNDISYAYLEENISKNNLQKVILKNEAISETNGLVNLFIHQSKPYLNSFLSSEAQPQSIAVNSVTLSSCIKNFSEIDLIKLDVEGKEFDIINELYSSKILNLVIVKNFIIEYHYLYSDNKANLNKFISIMDEMGYQLNKRLSLYPDNFDDEVFFFSRK